MKSLKDISWNVPEEVYRADPALSYSTLAKYEREGFNNLEHLFDKLETPSLTFGSAVDAIITGGQEEFDKGFMVAEFPSIPDSIATIVKELFQWYNPTNRTLESIEDDFIIKIALKYNYQPNWKPETRAKVIKERGSEYYSLLYVAGDRTILNTSTYQDVCNAVKALKESASTKFYFAEDNPFEPEIERFYQLKFKATLGGIDYRCMFDELIVNHNDKTIQPIDLKTSCKKSDREWDFPKHYIEWGYQLQNRLYVRILQSTISRDEYFNDFKILPYKDIIIFRNSDTPLVWDIPFTFALGSLYLGKDSQIVMRDPEDIGKELAYYLKNKPKVPLEINEVEPNNLRYWINRL